MPTPQIPSIPDNANLQELRDALVGISRYLNYLLSSLDTLNVSRLDAKVIIAETITADKMNVNELSAISANLGHITAGLIETIQMIGSVITGSLIQTNELGIYPRIELSSTSRIMRAESSPNEHIGLYASNQGTPSLVFVSGSNNTFLLQADDIYGITTTQRVSISGNLGVSISSQFGYVNFSDWGNIRSTSTGQTLQQVLNTINARLTALETSP